MHQGVLLVTRGRVDHQARRLGEHRQGVVLIEDSKRYIRLGDIGRGYRCRNLDLNTVPGMQAMAGLTDQTIDQHLAGTDDMLHLRARPGRERLLVRQKMIQPLAGIAGHDCI